MFTKKIFQESKREMLDLFAYPTLIKHLCRHGSFYPVYKLSILCIYSHNTSFVGKLWPAFPVTLNTLLCRFMIFRQMLCLHYLSSPSRSGIVSKMQTDITEQPLFKCNRSIQSIHNSVVPVKLSNQIPKFSSVY